VVALGASTRDSPLEVTSTSATVIVVPDGLAARGRPPRAVPEPSFAFRAVLDRVAEHHRDAHVLLAPANDFGCGVTEQEVGRQYLAARGVSRLEAPPTPPGGYVDTRGNASALRDHLERTERWPLGPATLVVAATHATRARLCFRREGFVLETVDAVPFAIPAGELVPHRLRFHRHRAAHRLYELAALARDGLRPRRR
jgi:uncharacterized SAM-binding protein YcdF (DUF218 family)